VIVDTVTVTPFANGCYGPPTKYYITVIPSTITVTPPPNQSVCNGQSTAAVNFSGTGTSYTWTNSNPAIGLAASGTGNIPSFVGTNPGTSPITGVITVTPYYASGCITCAGPSPVSFTITVNPVPTITLGTNPTVCAGSTFANLPYSATTASPTTYSIDWNLAAQGAGFIDVINAILPASPIVLVVPAAAPAGTYTGILTVSTGSCTSINYTISVTINSISPGTLGPIRQSAMGVIRLLLQLLRQLPAQARPLTNGKAVRLIAQQVSAIFQERQLRPMMFLRTFCNNLFPTCWQLLRSTG
jgi:hypothetical protein